MPDSDPAASGGRETDLPSTPLEADRGPAPGGAYNDGEPSDADPVRAGGAYSGGEPADTWAGVAGGAYRGGAYRGGEGGGDRGRRAASGESGRRLGGHEAGEADEAGRAGGAGGQSGGAEPAGEGEGGEATTAIGRRVVLGMVGLGALGIVVGGRVQGAVERALRPVSQNDPTGLTSFVPTGGRFRIYSVTSTMPSRSQGEYRLTVDGLVDRPLDLSYDQLLDLPQTDLVRDFQCVTGWRVPDVPWRGVKVATLLDQAGVSPTATHLRLYSFDGVYTESLSLDQARRDDVIVAHRMMGGPVSREHGGPVRLYVAPMYGYKSLKWLERIEVVDELVPGYWEERGYDIDAWVGESNGRDDEPVEA